MNGYRWAVEKVRVACELSYGHSVIHPCLIKTGKDELMLFGNSYPSGNRFNSKSYDIIVAYSADGGNTWSEPKNIFTDPLICGRPTYVSGGLALSSGRIICIAGFIPTDTGPVDQLAYRNTGKISPYGRPITEATGGYGIKGAFRPLISDDKGITWRCGSSLDVMGYCTGGPLSELHDNTLLLPVYGFRNSYDMEHWQFSNAYLLSGDGGMTWSPPAIVAEYDQELHDFPNEMAIVELPDGCWIALYRNQFFRHAPGSACTYVYRSYSYDKGKSWTTGQQIFPSMGYTCARLMPDGSLLVVGHSMMGISYVISSDHGETWDYWNNLWSYDIRLGGDCGGFSIVSDENKVMIAYYAKADPSKDVLSTAADRYGKMRLEIAWLNRVKADSAAGRMR